jgi:hypothetical protein
MFAGVEERGESRVIDADSSGEIRKECREIDSVEILEDVGRGIFCKEVSERYGEVDQ